MNGIGYHVAETGVKVSTSLFAVPVPESSYTVIVGTAAAFETKMPERRAFPLKTFPLRVICEYCWASMMGIGILSHGIVSDGEGHSSTDINAAPRTEKQWHRILRTCNR